MARPVQEQPTRAEPTDAERLVNAKRRFFNELAQQHWPEMRLLFRGGKLSKSEGWRNVAEHCVVQMAAAEVMADTLHLPETEKVAITKVAGVHDWEKRLQRRPEQFTPEERVLTERLLEVVQPDSHLMEATSEAFIERVGRGDSTFLERLQFYIDDICRGSEIVTLAERFADLRVRRADLGSTYWDQEDQLAHQVQTEVYGLLQAQGVNLNSPEDIPQYLRQQIEAKIRQHL